LLHAFSGNIARNGRIFVLPADLVDFIYIDDVVDAYMAAIERTLSPGTILNVCTGIQHNLGNVAEELSGAVGVELPVKWSGEGRSFDTDVWVGDSTQTKDLLKWQSRISLQEGITKMLAWMKENRKQYETA